MKAFDKDIKVAPFNFHYDWDKYSITPSQVNAFEQYLQDCRNGKYKLGSGSPYFVTALVQAVEYKGQPKVVNLMNNKTVVSYDDIEIIKGATNSVKDADYEHFDGTPQYLMKLGPNNCFHIHDNNDMYGFIITCKIKVVVEHNEERKAKYLRIYKQTPSDMDHSSHVAMLETEGSEFDVRYFVSGWDDEDTFRDMDIHFAVEDSAKKLIDATIYMTSMSFAKYEDDTDMNPETHALDDNIYLNLKQDNFEWLIEKNQELVNSDLIGYDPHGLGVFWATKKERKNAINSIY